MRWNEALVRYYSPRLAEAVVNRFRPPAPGVGSLNHSTGASLLASAAPLMSTLFFLGVAFAFLAALAFRFTGFAGFTMRKVSRFLPFFSYSPIQPTGAPRPRQV